MNVPINPDAHEYRLIDKITLCHMLSWSESSVDRRLREDPYFPRPRRLGRHTVRWILSEVHDYIRNLPEADEADEAYI